MILLPAVDILDGKTVRLAKGSFDSRTVYDADPLDAARRWVKGGARMLHVVDLDGARTGTPRHLELVSKIANTVDVPIELGGGLRTVAYRDVDFLDEVLGEHGDRVVVSIDARNGRLAAEGWMEQTDIPDESVVAHFGARGVRRFIYSSIEHDGTLSGPDLGGARRIASAVRGSFIYSGGVSSLDDLRALAALRQVNLAGVIVGKALYEQHFGVGEAQRVLEGA